MTESATEPSGTYPEPPPPPHTSRIDALEESVRRLSGTVTILTAFAVILCLAVVAVFASAVVPTWSSMDKPRAEVFEQQLQGAFPDVLRHSDVRLVKVRYDKTPFPFSLFETVERSAYMEYQLQGSDVVVADILDASVGDDALSSGMLPTVASLSSRMTTEQFRRLLSAYGRQTRYPLGGVQRYADSEVSDGMTSEGTVPIGEKEYKASELWAARVGKLVQGDTVDAENVDRSARATLVFHQDPSTGEFVYLGTEPDPSSSWSRE